MFASRINTRNMLLISLFAALTAIGAFIRIPTPIGVPFTLQFLFCAYGGLFLGWRNAGYAQGLYVGLGLLGLPIFTQGGGIGYIFQPSFGFLIGFIFAAIVIGYGRSLLRSYHVLPLLGIVLFGLFVLYLTGFAYLYLLLNYYMNASLTGMQVFSVGILPFILPDLIWCLVIAVTGVKVLPILEKSGYLKE